MAYSARAAYKMLFKAIPTTSHRSIFGKCWVPGTVKMFAWLLHTNRLWCNERLQRRGWPNGYFYSLCMQNLESALHLMWECPLPEKFGGLLQAGKDAQRSAWLCNLLIAPYNTAWR